MKGINGYLNFDGDCAAAMEFYQKCFGGELDVSRFGDVEMELPPGAEDRVMHARLETGAVVLMASDTMPGMEYVAGNNMWLNIDCDSAEEVDRLHGQLTDGGESKMEPQDTFWNAHFAMATDRYGINWMLNYTFAG